MEHAQGQVVFVREESGKSPLGNRVTYRIYRASSPEAAKFFLKSNPVDKALLYLVVQTPAGNYCRDKDGIYRE
jgi:hypothetical protein